MRASKGLVALALAGVAMSMSGTLSGPAMAQIRLPEASTDDEVPLPDIAAIERGAKARASVSFGRPTAQEPAPEPVKTQVVETPPAVEPPAPVAVAPIKPAPAAEPEAAPAVDALPFDQKRVVYLVDDRIVGEAECDPEHPAEAQRFPLEHAFRAAGKYRLRARVHLVPAPANRLEAGQVPRTPGVFWSPGLEVQVEHVEPAWLVEQRGDHAPNLLDSAHPRLTATSYVRADEPWTDDRPRGDFPPSKAADGLLRTSWLADPADPLPRLTIALAKPREADVILLSQARSAPYRPGVLARALTVEVTINGRERHTVRMFADERRKGRLVLERPVAIVRLELAIPQKAPGAAHQCVGLAEVELRRGP